MGNHDFSSELLEYFIRTVDTNELLSFNPIAVQELYAENLYDSIQSTKAKGKVMEGDRDSRFDIIVDVINDARIKGLLPIEISICQDVQTPDYSFNSKLGICELLPVCDYTINIRLREQNQ